MMRWLVNRRLNRMEKFLGVPIDETRYMAAHSLDALRACAGLRQLSEYHGSLDLEVYFTAKIAAYRQQDCGSCLQITVNLARKAKVRAELIRDLIAGRVQALPEPLRDVYRFAEEQANRIDNPELRELLRQRYGDAGLITLALAITSAGTFPTMKRALGYATSCSRVQIVA
jgi:hypothetical protein